MPRSVKKGPFVDDHLLEKVEKMNDSRDSKLIKTWSRRSTIVPEMIGHTFGVHNGRNLSQCMLQKIWLATSLGSFLLPGFLKAMVLQGPKRVLH